MNAPSLASVGECWDCFILKLDSTYSKELMQDLVWKLVCYSEEETNHSLWSEQLKLGNSQNIVTAISCVSGSGGYSW